MRKLCLATLLALTLVALPLAANSISIESGIDVWWTPADGSTRADFQSDPIPADFFCRGAEPFEGTINFRGVPVATDPEGILAGADTVIYRLDDANFDGKGTDAVRVQVAALELASVHPIVTRCGDFDVRASLAGEQPVTNMQITYDGENGGSYVTPLALNVRLSFTPTEGARRAPLVLTHKVELDIPGEKPWVSQIPGRSRAAAGFVTVDTDGDGSPDTLLPGTTSNFYFDAQTQGKYLGGCTTCHSGGGHQHCFYNECGCLGPNQFCP
jgi:hypothetical protein